MQKPHRQQSSTQLRHDRDCQQTTALHADTRTTAHRKINDAFPTQPHHDRKKLNVSNNAKTM